MEAEFPLKRDCILGAIVVKYLATSDVHRNSLVKIVKSNIFTYEESITYMADPAAATFE